MTSTTTRETRTFHPVKWLPVRVTLSWSWGKNLPRITFSAGGR